MMNFKNFTLNIKNNTLTVGEWMRAELSRLMKTVNQNIVYSGGSRETRAEFGDGIVIMQPECMYQSLMLDEALAGRMLNIQYPKPLHGAILRLIYKGEGAISYGDQSLVLAAEGEAFASIEILFIETDKNAFSIQRI